MKTLNYLNDSKGKQTFTKNKQSSSTYIIFYSRHVSKYTCAYYKSSHETHMLMVCQPHLFCINSGKLFYFLSISDNTNDTIHILTFKIALVN